MRSERSISTRAYGRPIANAGRSCWTFRIRWPEPRCKTWRNRSYPHRSIRDSRRKVDVHAVWPSRITTRFSRFPTQRAPTRSSRPTKSPEGHLQPRRAGLGVDLVGPRAHAGRLIASPRRTRRSSLRKAAACTTFVSGSRTSRAAHLHRDADPEDERARARYSHERRSARTSRRMLNDSNRTSPYPVSRPARPEPRHCPIQLKPSEEASGEFLRKAREAMGLELSTISEETKIGRSILESIEEERLDRLPAAGVFAQLHPTGGALPRTGRGPSLDVLPRSHPPPQQLASQTHTFDVRILL